MNQLIVITMIIFIVRTDGLYAVTIYGAQIRHIFSFCRIHLTFVPENFRSLELSPLK